VRNVDEDRVTAPPASDPPRAVWRYLHNRARSKVRHYVPMDPETGKLYWRALCGERTLWRNPDLWRGAHSEIDAERLLWLTACRKCVAGGAPDGPLARG
jgi:hypothetical protein